MQQFVWLRYDPYSLLVNGIIFFFSNLITFIVHSLKDSQNFFMQSSLLYACLFSMPSNDHIVDTEYIQGICSPIFVVDDFYTHIFFESKIRDLHK